MVSGVEQYVVKCPGCGMTLYYAPHKSRAVFCPFCRKHFCSGKYEDVEHIPIEDMPICSTCEGKKKHVVQLTKSSDGNLKCPECNLKYIYINNSKVMTDLPDVMYPFRVSRFLAAKVMASWLCMNEFIPDNVIGFFDPSYIDAIYVPIVVFEGKYTFKWDMEGKTRHSARLRGTSEGTFKIPYVINQDVEPSLKSVFNQTAEESEDKAETIKNLNKYNFVPLLASVCDKKSIYQKYVSPALKETFLRKVKVEVGVNSTYDSRINIASDIVNTPPRVFLYPFWIAAYRYDGGLYRCVCDGMRGFCCGGDIPINRKARVRADRIKQFLIISLILLLLATAAFFLQGADLKSPAGVFFISVAGIAFVSVFIFFFRFIPMSLSVKKSMKKRLDGLNNFIAANKLENVVEFD